MKTQFTDGRNAPGGQLFFKLLLVLVVVSALAGQSVRAERLVGGGLFNIADLDPANGADTFAVDLPTYNCWNANPNNVDSIESHPDSGQLYGILRGNPNTLVTINTTTGQINTVASTGEPDAVGELTTITFGPGPDYLIYAIQGGNSEGTGSIWTVNPATGQPTDTGWTTSGSVGHALEFNPDDGQLYHFYSFGGSARLETIDPGTGVATEVTLSGDAFTLASGITYAGSNLFYAYDNVNGRLLSITSAGVVSLLSTPLDFVEGLDYASSILWAVDESGKLFQYDPGTGDRSNEVSVGAFEQCNSSITGMAKDPATNDYYVITEKDDPLGGDDEYWNSLAMIDLDTGLFSNQVNLSSWGVSGITVGPLGVLYGVLDYDAPLGKGTIVTIDKVTGQVTDTGWATNKSADGHSLEYNPDDGLLYHFYTDGDANDEEKIETIDPDTGDVVHVGRLSLNWFTFPVQGVVYRGNGLFYVLDSLRFIYTVNTDGEAIEVSGGLPQAPYAALELAPDRVNIALERAKLKRQIRKVKKALRKAKQRGQKAKVRSLSRKLRKLKRELRAL